MNEKKNEHPFNLRQVTGHDAGIVVYDGTAVLVANWADMADNRLPAYLAHGIVFGWPFETISIEDRYKVEDIRDELPGTVWLSDDEENVLDTDLDIIYDEFGDIPALFGFDTGAGAMVLDHPTSGVVYILDNGIKIIAPDEWN